MAGGLLWIAGAVLHSLKPRGCVGDECARMPMRQSTLLDGILAISATLLILAGLAGLVVLARGAGRFGRMGRTGVLCGVTGLSVLLLAGVVQALFYEGDFPLMPYFVIPGVLAVVVGFLLVAAAILRAQVLPRWAAVLLVVGSVALLGANEQTALVLLFIPFGLAWMGVGYVLWTSTPPRPGLEDPASDRYRGRPSRPAERRSE